ncbi:MAG: PEP-CTERM sorting domain-containing protein [Caldimonas sp.]
MSTKIFDVLIAAVGLALLALPAHAEVRIDVRAVGGGAYPVSEYSFTEPDGVTISKTVSSGGSVASASADLSAGVLRALADSADHDAGSATYAVPTFGDTFTFSGPMSGTAYLDYSFEGTIVVDPAKPFAADSFAEMLVYVSSIAGAATYDLTLSSVPGWCSAFSQALATLGCVEGTSIAATGSIPIAIVPGDIYILNQLGAFAQLGDSVSFENTARFAFRLPDGVSIQSRTGQFLATAAPIVAVPAVPEPATWALLLAGAGILASAARGRRS